MDKKTLLAVVLSVAVLFAWQTFVLPPPAPKAPPAPAPAEPEAPAPALQPAAPSPVAPPPDDAVLRDLLARQAEALNRTLRVSNGLYEVVFDTRGGGVTSWRLLDYRGPDGQPLELAPETPPGSPPLLGISFADPAQTAVFAQGAHLAEGGDLSLDDLTPEGTLSFSMVDPSGLVVTRRFTFRHGSYLVDVEAEVQNSGGATRDLSWWLVWGPGLGRALPGTRAVYEGPMIYNGAKVTRDRPKHDGERLGVAPGFKWAGLTSRYFLSAFVPGVRDSDAFVQRNDKTTYSVGVGPRGVFLPPGSAMAYAGQIFVGPKSLDLLKGYALGLDQSMDFGWFGWLGRPLLKVLKFFHDYVGNWGVAIILLTLLVKFLLFPVTFKMYKSMRRMQQLQPQMAALKKKHKDDPQTLNKEMMELYREHKINPAGGCLPMVIQIPIFFALYKVLSIAIELRGAGFLHIRDLSAAETSLGEALHGIMPFIPAGLLPIKVLVILMGASMFLQQRLSPTTGDPRQAKMMAFFPLIFLAMFWNFSSGLVVYFFFSNMLAIGEQFLIRKWTAPIPEPAAPRKKGKK